MKISSNIKIVVVIGQKYASVVSHNSNEESDYDEYEDPQEEQEEQTGLTLY